MEVILKQDIEKLGESGDIVNVKPGYGRNFLIPTGAAILATISAKKMQAENAKQRAHKKEKLKAEKTSLAEKVEKATIKVGAKVGENGKIFGSVSNVQVADALRKLGFEIERKNISIKGEPVKAVGTYEAEIKFHKEISKTVSFEVVEE